MLRCILLCHKVRGDKIMKILKYILSFVFVIVGFLPVFWGPYTFTCGQRTIRSTMCLSMDVLKKRFWQFKLDNGTLPSTQEGMQALVKNPNLNKYPNYPVKPYLKKIKLDSWSNPFIYVNKNNEIEIISYAADRKKGGVHFAKDILLSECNK